jgi:pimeloyl-ACP methyl ester carboxylesterase
MKIFNLPYIRHKLDDSARAHLPGSFVRLSKGVVHYELSGPVNGPVVVLIPGLSVPFAIWDRNVPALATAGFRVLRYDMYGRGFSDRPRIRYDLELFVHQVEELIGALKLRTPVTLVGFSMGGPVSAAAALRAGLANAIVLIDPLFEWREPSGTAALLKLPVVGDMIMALGGGSFLAGAQRTDFFDGREYNKFLPDYVSQLAYRGFSRAVIASIRSMPTWPLREIYLELGHKNLPGLLFWGREDVTVPFADSSRLVSLFPNVCFREVAGVAHIPHWEQSQIVNSILIEFLKKIPGDKKK